MIGSRRKVTPVPILRGFGILRLSSFGFCDFGDLRVRDFVARFDISIFRDLDLWILEFSDARSRDSAAPMFFWDFEIPRSRAGE